MAKKLLVGSNKYLKAGVTRLTRIRMYTAYSKPQESLQMQTQRHLASLHYLAHSPSKILILRGCQGLDLPRVLFVTPIGRVEKGKEGNDCNGSCREGGGWAMASAGSFALLWPDVSPVPGLKRAGGAGERISNQ